MTAPNENRPYIGRTFTSMPSGTIGVQNRNSGGHFLKSAFALWQVRINNRILSHFSLIVLIMLRPTPVGIRYEVLALAREGMRQSDIAGRVGLTRATVNRIHWRHAATGTLVPGKSMAAPQKSTPRQDRSLFKMVRQDRFLSARIFTAQMRNME